VTKFRALQSKQ